MATLRHPSGEYDPQPWIRHLSASTESVQRYTLAELYHENSKYHRNLMVSEPLSTDGITLGRVHPPVGAQPLPKPTADLPCTFGAALRSRRSVRRFQPGAMTQQTLSDLLFYSAGITGVQHMPVRKEWVEVGVRSYPSGGSLYPVDVYVIPYQVEGVAPGLYGYEPSAHELCPSIQDPGLWERLKGCTPLHPAVVDLTHAQAVIGLVANFPRQQGKYRRRAYRFTLQESGHLAQNLLLTAVALELGAVPVGAYFDDEVNRLFGLDGVGESVLYLIPVGLPDLQHAPGEHRLEGVTE